MYSGLKGRAGRVVNLAFSQNVVLVDRVPGALPRATVRSGLQPEGHRTVIDQLHLHSGAEAPGTNRRVQVFGTLQQMQKQPLSERRWRGGGKTWPIKRLAYKDRFAYSSMTSGRPGTPSEGWIYLNFEGGPKGGSTVARFNLAWLITGEPTGDGSLPDWLEK